LPAVKAAGESQEGKVAPPFLDRFSPGDFLAGQAAAGVVA